MRLAYKIRASSLIAFGLLSLYTGCSKKDPAPAVKPAASVTTPNSAYVSTYCTDIAAGGKNSVWTRDITETDGKAFVIRFSSRFNADAGLFDQEQIINFVNFQSATGYGAIPNGFGTRHIRIPPGKYTLAVRNRSGKASSFSLELDYEINLPPTDMATLDFPASEGAQTLDPGTVAYQPFAIEAGYRYFLDGNNTGLSTYIFGASEIEKFKNSQAINFHSQYSSPTVNCEMPGLIELVLPVGNYFIGFRNDQTVPNSFTYTIDRWRLD